MESIAINKSAIDQLPISKRKKEIIHAIRNNPVVIISGETGSGKTTQIPKFCMEAGRGKKGMIGCTQPRRIAAITVAARIAHELGEPVGTSVGYKIRFDDKTDKHSRIKLMTDGILLAETQKDRFLKKYDTIIVDEAHERSLNIDFTLGILRTLVKKRKDLKLIITSATIDTEKFSTAFDNAPIIEVSGRMFPVDVRYMPLGGADDSDDTADDQAYVEAAADAVKQICLESKSGDILVFMPTEQDIGETLELIRGRNIPGITVLPLFARLSAREQSRVFSSTIGRKIIVATNVAETSLTIPGIKYVIDTGLARIPHYSPRTRTTALPVTAISKSSADQRKGRCGRVENGICIRLYSDTDYSGRPFFTSPEILRSNLAEVILRMISLNLGDISSFPFIDKPSPKSIKDGFDTLLELGAIRPVIPKGQKNPKKTYELTAKGRIMSRIPVDPKLSRILLEANDKGCLGQAVIIVSALAISDPRQRPQDKTQQADQKHALFKDPASDFVTLLNIWEAYQAAQKMLKSRNSIRKWCMDHYLSFKRIREWTDIHQQITSILKEHRIIEKTPLQAQGSKNLKSKEFEIGGPLYIALHQSLLYGYLANIAHRSDKNMFTAAKGQKAMIFPGSGVFDSAGNWIMAAEFVKTSQLFARTVACIDPAWLEDIGKDLCVRTYSDPHWEKKRQEVMANEQVTLFGLVIVGQRRKAYGPVNPQEAGDIFIRQALVEGDIQRPFEFMKHNMTLMEQIKDLEHKTRKKNILATEEDIFEFYQSRLPNPFYNIRTFTKFLNDQADDAFLKMTIEDLQKEDIDETILTSFPDVLKLDQADFTLEYHFDPGSKKDGITVNVPSSSVDSLSLNRMDSLVPGLFEEKVIALIKNLPKKYRRLLVPVSEKAAIIATEMVQENKPLFVLLTRFVKQRFNADIPATAWSQDQIPDHLKMRIAITDDKGKKIFVSRDTHHIHEFSQPRPPVENKALRTVRKKMERTNLTEWNFPDLDPFITIFEDDGTTLKLFPGLVIEQDQVALRLSRSREKALESHCSGVAALFVKCFPDDFKALEKDINSISGFNWYATLLNGIGDFKKTVFACIKKDLFAVNIRTKQDFYRHAEQTLPGLYEAGQALVKTLLEIFKEYDETVEVLKKLGRATLNHPQTQTLINTLYSDLKNLVPANLCELYDIPRINTLKRYVTTIRIRAQRACDNYAKDEIKARTLQTYTRYFDRLLNSLSSSSSSEKIREVEALHWMIEEFKISLFAQEIKTLVKVSPKILDTLISRISNMI